MCEFHCDINREEDGHLVQAIQTILDAISTLKSELKKTQNDRDQLKAQLKSLNDTLSVSVEAPRTSPSLDRRKRKKYAIHHDELNVSEANVSVDLNNAAFLLSSTCGDDEDVIGPTQFSKSPSPLRVNVNRSTFSRKPCVDSSKENQEKVPQLSPIGSYVTTKTSKIFDTSTASVRKNLFDSTESIGTEEFIDNKASERLFDNNWISKKPATAIPTSESNKLMTKKKNRLSLAKTQSSAPKLRQATISFQKTNNKLQNDDETYCDDFATFNQSGDDSFMKQKSPANVSSNASSQDSVRNAMARIKIEKTSPTNMSLVSKKSPTGSGAEKPGPRLKSEPETDGASTSSVIIAEDAIDEIITLEDTQSSLVNFDYIFGDKTDSEGSIISIPTKKLGAYQPDEAPIGSQSLQSKKHDDQKCPDCEKYEQVLVGATGGRTDANAKCYRHLNENMRPATPPNYWDPRIPDTPEGEHIETPFDYRFL